MRTLFRLGWQRDESSTGKVKRKGQKVREPPNQKGAALYFLAETFRRNACTRKDMTMTTEHDARTDPQPESYDPFSEPTTFPSGLRLADAFDMMRERPRDSLPVAADQTVSKPSGESVLS